jgi:hypothetical protein
MSMNSGAHSNSGELRNLWFQVVGLASAVGEIRGRVTRLERLEERRQQWEASMGDPYGSEQPKQESLLQRIFRLRELAEAVVMLMKIARHLPWGTLVLVAVSIYKWAVPLARDTGLAFLRWLGL